jgi:threonine aldolase
MNHLNRRSFLTTTAALGIASRTLAAVSPNADDRFPPEKTVHFLHDGIHRTPLEYAELLVRLCKEQGVTSDTYLSGGAVANLETAMAKVLGKESAVFVPTGTLANHLALRVLTAGKSRALVQAESHIYCDSLDCVQTLSHLNLVPLAENRATFTLAEVQDAVKRATNGPFPLQVGAISIECPVRRKNGEVFDYEEMKRVASFARGQGIKLHLDGARLFIASAYTGIAPAEYASCFDTVYISLYKYLGAATGAILAGPKGVVQEVAHARKLFGGGLLEAWPYAAVALYSLDGFLDRYRKAVGAARGLFAALEQHSGFRVESFPHGTNLFWLHVPAADTERYRTNLRERGIVVRPAPKGAQKFMLIVNESLNRRPSEELAGAFVAALPSR